MSKYPQIFDYIFYDYELRSWYLVYGDNDESKGILYGFRDDKWIRYVMFARG